MMSRVVKFFARFLSWINICYCESLFGRIFNSLWNALGHAFSGSFIYRFFSDESKRENVWESSAFGKIANLPKTIIIILQKKLSPFLTRQLNRSALCTAFSAWNLVSVRFYGILILAFSVATTFLSNNSKFVLLILVLMDISGFLLILVNRSLKQLTSGSKIIKMLCELFIEYKESENDKIINCNKPVHYLTACVIGVLLSIVYAYAGTMVFLLFLGIVLSFAFLMKYLRLGVFLTVALSPVLPTMVLVLLAFICAFVFFVHVIIDDKFTFSKSSFNVAVIFFVVSLVWGVINSFAPLSSLKQVMVHMSFILFYFVLTNVIRTKKEWTALVKIFMLSAFVVALYGVFQNFFGASSTDSWIDEEMFSDIKLRVYSFFNNPNVLGEFLVLTIPVAIALLWSRVRDTHKILFAFVLIFMVACMIFTWSRGAWLGMIFALAIFLVIADKRWMFAGVLALFLIPVLLYATGNIAILERFISIGNTNDTSTAYRVSIWQASIAMISDFWVGGIGIGSDAYTTIYPSYALPGARFALHSHNLYLQFLVETGIVGIVSLFAVLLGFLKSVFSTAVVRKIKQSDVSKILVAMGAGLLGFGFQGLTDYVWYNYKIVMIFWIIMALGISGAKILKEDKGGDSL